MPFVPLFLASLVICIVPTSYIRRALSVLEGTVKHLTCSQSNRSNAKSFRDATLKEEKVGKRMP